jgi:hypothetical protein
MTQYKNFKERMANIQPLPADHPIFKEGPTMYTPRSMPRGDSLQKSKDGSSPVPAMQSEAPISDGAQKSSAESLEKP